MNIEVLEPITCCAPRRSVPITGAVVWRVLVLLLLVVNLVMQVKNYQRTVGLESSSWSEMELIHKSSLDQHLRMMERISDIEATVAILQIESQRKDFK